MPMVKPKIENLKRILGVRMCDSHEREYKDVWPGDNEVRFTVVLRLLTLFIHEQPADDGVSEGGHLATRLHVKATGEVTAVNAVRNGVLQQSLRKAEGTSAEENNNNKHQLQFTNIDFEYFKLNTNKS